jgi:cobalt/nickel transport system permease protein
VHIPDGFIDGKTAATTAVLSAAGVGFALRRVRREMPARNVPMLGLAAAFLFVAQMVNFPVAGGTSGHLVGGVLVAALLGPSAAVVVLTTVLIVQSFVFQDGGVLALGANIFNMAILDSVAGYGIYRAVGGWVPGARGRVTAIAFAGWCATVLAAASCAGELAWSGVVAWRPAFTAMVGVHLLIGLGEGLISALVFLAIQRARPEIVADAGRAGAASRWGEWTIYGLLVVLGLALFVTPFACPWPDGLERVAARFGFAHRAAGPILAAPAPDYRWPGLHWATGATALAAVLGALVVFALALLLGRLLVPKERVDCAHPIRTP